MIFCLLLITFSLGIFLGIISQMREIDKLNSTIDNVRLRLKFHSKEGSEVAAKVLDEIERIIGHRD